MSEQNPSHEIYIKDKEQQQDDKNAWISGEPITANKMTAISSELSFLSKEISDVYNQSTGADASKTSKIINHLFKYGAPTEDEKPYTKFYVDNTTENSSAIIKVPTMEDLNEFKEQFIPGYQ